MGQFLKLDSIIEIIKELKDQKKRIVATNGCFDILHIGHYNYLKDAKKCGDILIVGVNSDSSVQKIKGPARPINVESDRASLVAGLDCVDFVFLFDEATAVDYLLKIRPDVYVKGDDYTMKNLPEAQTVYEIGSEIVFIKLTEGKSSSDVIDKVVVNYMNFEKDN